MVKYFKANTIYINAVSPPHQLWKEIDQLSNKMFGDSYHLLLLKL